MDNFEDLVTKQQPHHHHQQQELQQQQQQEQEHNHQQQQQQQRPVSLGHLLHTLEQRLFQINDRWAMLTQCPDAMHDGDSRGNLANLLRELQGMRKTLREQINDSNFDGDPQSAASTVLRERLLAVHESLQQSLFCKERELFGPLMDQAGRQAAQGRQREREEERPSPEPMEASGSHGPTKRSAEPQEPFPAKRRRDC